MDIKYKKISKEILSLAFYAFVIFSFKSTVFGNYTIPTGSMEPSILPGDKVLVNNAAFNIRIPFTQIVLLKTSEPERGDVINLAPPEGKIDYIKRLIGLPGDIITVADGKISINGKHLNTSVTNEEFEEISYYGGHYTETLGNKTYTVQRLPHTPNFREKTWVVPKGH